MNIYLAFSLLLAASLGQAIRKAGRIKGNCYVCVLIETETSLQKLGPFLQNKGVQKLKLSTMAMIKVVKTKNPIII